VQVRIHILIFIVVFILLQTYIYTKKKELGFKAAKIDVRAVRRGAAARAKAQLLLRSTLPQQRGARREP